MALEVTPPRLLDAPPRTTLDPGALRDDPDLEGAHLQDVDLASEFLRAVRLRDCRFERGNLANAQVRGGVAERVAFEGTRMTGFSFQDGLLRDVLFRGCRLDLASFAATRLERVRFEDCVLRQSELQDARLTAVLLQSCGLEEADLKGSRWAVGCELRDCVLDGARGVEDLGGVSMPYEDVLANAITLAGALRIGVLGDDD